MLTAFRSNAVFLTGASRGIGREMALQLARSGARLALMARNREDLERTADACRRSGAQAIVVPGDVAVEEDCAAAVLRAREELGTIDTLIARHGVSVTVAYPGFVDTGIRERAVGEGPGRPTGPHAGRIMSASECATRILRGAARRRREVVMTGKGRAGRWLKLVAPQMVDRVAARSVGFGA
ncbi:MAG: SDR family NAD(P)-dependent oxidoreductase [Gemmatimonadetes bacterium]|nr:SDR family NAD(P)-dependent oxidoreductase [Gemmatimonadota bacterium]